MEICSRTRLASCPHPQYHMRGGTYRLPTRRHALVHNPLLHLPYPERQGAVEDGVQDDGERGVQLRVLEAQLVVPEETGAGYGERRIAQGEADVGQVVGLAEFETVEVVGNGIIGGVFEI